jgi:hypothetical protein
MTIVEDEWSLCYDAQLDFSNISSLSKYKTCILETRESSDEDNQSELPQNYGYGRGRERGRGYGRPHCNSRGSTTITTRMTMTTPTTIILWEFALITFPQPIWFESILQLVIH